MLSCDTLSDSTPFVLSFPVYLLLSLSFSTHPPFTNRSISPFLFSLSVILCLLFSTAHLPLPVFLHLSQSLPLSSHPYISYLLVSTSLNIFPLPFPAVLLFYLLAFLPTFYLSVYSACFCCLSSALLHIYFFAHCLPYCLFF
jgi:hypothetical protein